MNALRLAQAIVVAGIAVGCGAKVAIDTGGSGSGGSAGTGGAAAGSVSCNLALAAAHVCYAYNFTKDPTGALAAAEVTACKSTGGTPEVCPTANALGTCSLPATAGATPTEVFYSDTSPPLTADDAQVACTGAGGTWM